MRKMNKGAQIFSVYLVVISIVMMAVVFISYYNHQKGLKSSLVNVYAAKMFEDEKTMFEFLEKEKIIEISRQSLDSGKKWNTPEMAEDVKKRFVEYAANDVFSENKHLGFGYAVFTDISLNGGIVDISDYVVEGRRDFFNRTYDFRFENNLLKAERKKITKVFSLKSDEKINFPVQMEISFIGRHSISFEDVNKITIPKSEEGEFKFQTGV